MLFKLTPANWNFNSGTGKPSNLHFSIISSLLSNDENIVPCVELSLIKTGLSANKKRGLSLGLILD